MTKLLKSYLLWKHFGASWLGFRVRYWLRARTGYYERLTPASRWDEHPLERFLSENSNASPERYPEYRRSLNRRFFFDPADRAKYQLLLSGFDSNGNSPIAEADGIARGEFRYFSQHNLNTGPAPKWNRNPFTGEEAPSDLHWSRISDFAFGDIKLIWELNRFGFVYSLVRAYWRTGDERFAGIFWQLVEDWMKHNPPNTGPNWKCGQETSFRVMAWCFGLYGFLDADSTTPERVVSLARMIAVSGRRIEANLGYALSQRNNHGISEGMGLWTIGCLFPEFRFAERWSETGRRVLESQGRELIYSDGSFSQHSVNYQRLMLHDYLWSLRLGELNDNPFSAELKERVGKAGSLLFQLQDEESGRVPNYGHNDGAMILPLNGCDYRDFRPVIQATHYLSTGSRCYHKGPWDEDLLWLFGPNACEAPIETPQRIDLNAEAGGYYTLRSKSGFAFVRCATFRDRPAQADMLHLDLWWRGQNIALDPGTYSYNAPPPWNNALGNTAYHNTVTVDGLDQMERAGTFLWLPWLRGRVQYHKQSPSGFMSYWEGEHDGYQRLRAPVSHRRGILHLGDDWWLVLDRLNSAAAHRYRLHWLFADVPYQWDESKHDLCLNTFAGPYHARFASSIAGADCSLVRADKDSARGWQSPYYDDRQPALSVDLSAQAKSIIFCTSFGPGSCEVALDKNELLVITDQWQGAIRLQNDNEDGQLIIASVSLDRGIKDQWEFNGESSPLS